MIDKVNQDMLDNDANLQNANEDKVDEKIPENEGQTSLDKVQPEPPSDVKEIEDTDNDQGEIEILEDDNLAKENPAISKAEEETYDDLNLEQLLHTLHAYQSD